MNVMFALFGLGGQEVLLIFGAFLLLFGAKKIPDFAKGLGQGIKEFKKATREVTEEIHHASESSSTPAPSMPPVSVAPVQNQVTDAPKTVLDPQRDPVPQSTQQKA